LLVVRFILLFCFTLLGLDYSFHSFYSFFLLSFHILFFCSFQGSNVYATLYCDYENSNCRFRNIVFFLNGTKNALLDINQVTRQRTKRFKRFIPGLTYIHMAPQHYSAPCWMLISVIFKNNLA